MQGEYLTTGMWKRVTPPWSIIALLFTGSTTVCLRVCDVTNPAHAFVVSGVEWQPLIPAVKEDDLAFEMEWGCGAILSEFAIWQNGTRCSGAPHVEDYAPTGS